LEGAADHRERSVRQRAPERRGIQGVDAPQPAVGRAAVTESARAFMVAFPDMQVLMDDLVVKGDGGAEYHWTLVGTNTGPDGTGNRVRIRASRSGRSVRTGS
jgi:hypothetical protein